MSPSTVSSEQPDWSREKPSRRWDPGARLLASVRSCQLSSRRSAVIKALCRPFCLLRYRFWSIVAAADIPLGCELGGGLRLPHPNGIVIHPDVKVGPNCLIFQQVTLGKGGPKPGAPIIGGHVDIGAGAKVLGGITIGDHARIGANAVVIDDVPPGATAVGIPARIIETSKSNLRSQDVPSPT